MTHPRIFKDVLDICTAAITEFYSVVIYNSMVVNFGNGPPFKCYGLNPSKLTTDQLKRPAILFLHGQHHNQTGILPLAKKLEKAGISPVFTLNLKYNENKPAHHERKLRERIEEIKALYEAQGQNHLDLIFIGHSRGGIEALNYTCCHTPQKNVTVKSIITVAARIDDVKSRWRYCPANIKQLLKNIIEAKQAHREVFYHIASSNDWIMPLEAAIFNDDHDRHHIITNRSHMGILYASETHHKIIDYLHEIYRS